MLPEVARKESQNLTSYSEVFNTLPVAPRGAFVYIKRELGPVSILAPTTCGTSASHWASLGLGSPVYINI